MEQLTQMMLLGAAGGDILFTRSTYSRIVSGSGTLAVPTGARAMRVAVIGGGGGATSATGAGGGGGCAASKIVLTNAVTYAIGAGGIANTDGGTSTASFGVYSLSASGGSRGSVRTGGAGTGGDYNFSGGAGGLVGGNAQGGGGAAGPSGNGGNCANPATAPSLGQAGNFDAQGWGCGGGGGGNKSSVDATGGGGAGASTGTANSLGTESLTVGGGPWGASPNGFTGGEMGGGGGMRGATTGSGGSGGMVVEWFYVD